MKAFRMTRRGTFALFAVCLWLAWWRAGTQVGPAEDSDLKRYSAARGALRELVDRSGELLTAREKQTLRDGVQQITLAFSIWNIGKMDAAAAKSVRSSCEPAMARIVSVLESSSEVVRLWLEDKRPAPEFPIRKRWVSGSGLVLLRVGSPGPEADSVPEFVFSSVDLAVTPSPSVRLNHARTVYAVLFLDNAKPGTTAVPITLTADGREIAKVNLSVDVPPPGHLKVAILDESGKPVPAVAGLYAPDHRLVVPAQALSFGEAGFSYRPGRVRPYQSSHYWPGSADERQVFFVDGGFSLDLPAGVYKLIVGRGFEYVPAIQTVRVEPGGEAAQSVTLKRWIDMPARGWYSGDGHVHYARAGEEANRRLTVWAQAEDVHMINVMRMGDALKTYFEQYAFGQTGRKVSSGTALVPGQEDPRTSFIGHTLHMNLHSAFRVPEQYYRYDLVFDEVHRQGGLSGYAHVYQPPNMGFWVREDMSINVPQQKVDFAEISEFGDIDEHLYYEFLNLGFKLTASAGSDVPWGNTIGTSRVYAYIGKHFDPDAWFGAVKAGRTFVTIGPMLELTVNGEVPGAEIQAKPGEMLRIQASARGYNVLPRYLEIVAQGEVVKSVPQSPGREPVSLEFRLPVRHSTWIAARCAGALTSPVYVRVGKAPFWKLQAVPELIETRLRQLHDVEILTQQGVTAGSEGGWNNPDGFLKQVPLLLERVEAARKIYRNMLEQAKAELSRQEASR